MPGLQWPAAALLRRPRMCAGCWRWVAVITRAAAVASAHSRGQAARSALPEGGSGALLRTAMLVKCSQVACGPLAVAC